MGILGMIARKKEEFQNSTVQMRKKVLLKKTEKLQADNARQSELTEARTNLEEAKLINQDLRQQSPTGPNKLQNLGRGMAKHMNKTKAKKGVKLKAIPSTGSKNLTEPVKGNPFGGQKNLDVGGHGLNMGGKGKSPFK